jgi:hypothetical protein
MAVVLNIMRQVPSLGSGEPDYSCTMIPHDVSKLIILGHLSIDCRPWYQHRETGCARFCLDEESLAQILYFRGLGSAFCAVVPGSYISSAVGTARIVPN